MSLLKETLQNNSRGKMVLMLAIANQCEKVIDVSFTEEYAKAIASAVAATQFQLTKEDKERFSKVISDALNKTRADMDNQSMDVSDKIISFGKAMVEEMEHEDRTTLESLIEFSEISRVDAISAKDAEMLILWLIAAEILKECPLCRETLKEASSYKKADQKKTDVKPSPKKEITSQKEPDKPDREEKYNSMNTDEIIKAIRNGEFMYFMRTEVPKKVQEVISGTRDLILREYNVTLEDISNGESLQNSADVLKAASKLKKSFKHETTPHVDALLRDHVATGGSTDSVATETSVIYSEVMYSIGEHIKTMDDPDIFVLECLRLPGISSIITESSPEKLDLAKVLGELKSLNETANRCIVASSLKGAIANFGQHIKKFNRG